MSSSETVKSLFEKALRNPPPDDFDLNMQERNEDHPKRSTEKKRRRGRKLVKPVTPPPAAVRNEEAMGHTFEKTKGSLRYNWEYISAFVNRAIKFYRSPRQCSLRNQLVVRPRETGQTMVVDPLTKKPRKAEMTPAEVAHQCEGRVSTDLQYAYDADRLREAFYTGRLQLIESLAAKQNEFMENRRTIDPKWLEPSGRLPAAQESRLSALGVRYDLTVCPSDIIKNLNREEEKRLTQEAAKKKLTKQQTSNEISPSSLRLILHHDPRDVGLPYSVNHQQIRVGPMQTSPPQQSMGQNFPMTTKMLPTRIAESRQPHQIHARPLVLLVPFFAADRGH
ncbi:unnamed protein product [Cylicocyclus nassatus]|uniref:Uncharacterized protein n=1 Tax=Cylicocyclus nassatus TaxID=53992 RepID=A0AA36ME20_CYLNA|nr:unnamed protein product [Cylicocyclus nassatus]